jgi:hypothetical protein
MTAPPSETARRIDTPSVASCALVAQSTYVQDVARLRTRCVDAMLRHTGQVLFCLCADCLMSQHVLGPGAAQASPCGLISLDRPGPTKER